MQQITSDSVGFMTLAWWNTRGVPEAYTVGCLLVGPVLPGREVIQKKIMLEMTRNVSLLSLTHTQGLWLHIPLHILIS